MTAWEHDAVAPGTLTSADDKIQSHESAAHEKRNWVRLSYDCNNHCVFCAPGNLRERIPTPTTAPCGRTWTSRCRS